VDRADLQGQKILIVEEQALVALDLQMALERAGAEVAVTRTTAEALGRISEFEFTAGIIDWRPQSDTHRVVARALKQRNVPFLFYATNPPEDVTTVRGAPILLKPSSPENIVQALALLTGARRGGKR
jgi:CheY-like chemotaxis protein